MKSVAIVTNSLSGGGAERAMNLLADNLANFPEVNLLLIPINAGQCDLIQPKCQISEIYRVWDGGVWETIKAFIRFQLTIFKFKPGVLILNCDLPEFFSALAFWRSKCVIVEHTTKPWAGRRTFGYVVRLILRARGATYVRVSERIEVSSFFKNSIVIPNMIDQRVIYPQSKKVMGGELLGKLLFVGRFSKEKRPELFIEIARASGIESLLIGDGILRFSLQQECTDLHNLKFLGHQLNPWEFASERDLLVLTSDFEGDGLVALEAISIGIPVALRNTPDLQRMGFPDRNYFDAIPALVSRLNESGFGDFQLTEDQRLEILKNRNPELVSKLWVEFLISLD